jgi:hypothetical protein
MNLLHGDHMGSLIREGNLAAATLEFQNAGTP